MSWPPGTCQVLTRPYIRVSSSFRAQWSRWYGCSHPTDALLRPTSCQVKQQTWGRARVADSVSLKKPRMPFAPGRTTLWGGPGQAGVRPAPGKDFPAAYSFLKQRNGPHICCYATLLVCKGHRCDFWQKAKGVFPAQLIKSWLMV